LSFIERTEEFLKLVDLEKSKLRKPRSSVFVCGGKLDRDPAARSSVRDVLLKSLPDRQEINGAAIILAEEAKDALAESNFQNLLDMEECIAAIVDAVLLIVESPGSVCEFGAFTKTGEIRRKLVAIISNEYANVPSFITLGPVKFVEGANDGGVVEPVPWDQLDGGVAIDGIALKAIVDECDVMVRSNFSKRESVSMETLGHRIYLVLAICHLLRGAKLGEVKGCLLILGVDLPEKDIRKYLDTLEVCGLLKTVRYTKKRIHYVPRTDRVVLEFAFKAGTPDADRNSLRWIDRIRDEIREDEPERLDIFQEHNDAA